MAGIEISDLPTVPGSALTDVFPGDQGSTTYKETLQQVLTLFQKNIVIPANGGIVYTDATQVQILAPTVTAGKVLLSGSSSAPSWSTPTYPSSSGTTGKILRSDGTNNAYSTSTFADTYTVSTILYASSANVITGLATANSGVLVTDAGGIPSIGATLPSAVQGNITSTGTITSGVWSGTAITLAKGGTNASLTASNGGIFYSTATAAAILAATATAGQILQSGSSAPPTWSTPTYPSSSGSAGTILRSNGTNNIYTTSTFADTYGVSTLLYASSANVITGLATANSGVLITSSGGVPSISSTLPSAVQANITAAGTIATGVWNGTAIDLAHGGTNANLTASTGGIFYSTSGAAAILAGTATAGKVLQSGATAAPTWSTPTYPSASGSAGVIIRSDGTNNVYTTSTFADTYAVSTLLYASNANTVSGLATANNGVLITSAGGVPSISSTLPSAVQGNITSTGTLANLTTSGTITAASNTGFNVRVSTTLNNVTGDGTTYTIIFDEEVFDNGNNYNSSTGTFTAPVTGKYLFSLQAEIGGLAIGNTSMDGIVVTTARTYFMIRTNPGVTIVSGEIIFSGACIADMTSGDTATVTVSVAGAGKVVDIFNQTRWQCWKVG